MGLSDDTVVGGEYKFPPCKSAIFSKKRASALPNEPLPKEVYELPGDLKLCYSCHFRTESLRRSWKGR